jgi:predicted nucleic acid-binding protein
VANYLLDADAVIDYLKEVAGTVSLLRDLVSQGDTLCISDVSLAEAYAGLYEEDEESAEAFLDTLSYLVTPAAAAEQAGRWRFQYARRGRNVPVTDALVAATAHFHGASVVTANVRDYPMPEVSILPLPR